MSEIGDRILGTVPDLPRTEIEIPEWSENGDRFYVKTWSGRERDHFDFWAEKRVGKSKDGSRANIRALCCAMALENEEGELVFDLRQVDKLGEQPARILQAIYEVAVGLNKISPKDHEEAEGN